MLEWKIEILSKESIIERIGWHTPRKEEVKDLMGINFSDSEFREKLDARQVVGNWVKEIDEKGTVPASLPSGWHNLVADYLRMQGGGCSLYLVMNHKSLPKQ